MTDYEYFRARDQFATEMRIYPDLSVLVDHAAYGLGIGRGRAAEFVERVLTDLSHHVERASRTAAQRPGG